MRASAFTLCLLLTACSSPGSTSSLERVDPPRVDEAQGGPVELHGANLRPAVQVDFDRPSSSVVNAAFTAWVERGGVVTDLADVTWQTPELVTATVPAGLATGVYDVHLVDPRGHEAMLANALEVVACLVSDCVPDGGDPTERFDAGWVPCGDFTFEDLDVDGFGAPDSGAFLCGDFRAAVAGDCNDRDGLMHPDAGEVCNRLDDDCDGVVDDTGCPDGGAAWALVRGMGPDWATAWSWSKGALWIAGGSDVLVRRGAGTFDAVSNGCPGNLIASWAEPSGRAYLAGGNPAVGRLTTHALSANSCGPARQVSDPVTGLVGFPRADGGVDVAGVLRNGRLVRGVNALDGPETPSNLSPSYRFNYLHGVAPGTLYAVGASSWEDSARMMVYRLGADGGWVDEHVARLPGLPRGWLRAVWVLDAERVVAVGDHGVVLERSRFGWRRLGGLDGDLRLTGVRAFDPGRVYVTDEGGAVRRWTGQRWERLYDGPGALRDVTGTAEDDLWCVGSGGAVVHWPE